MCASADMRSGAGSVVTWAEGVWLQANDGTAVLVDTQQSARTIIVKTIEVLPHSAIAPDERPAAATVTSPGGEKVGVEERRGETRAYHTFFSVKDY